MGSTLATGLNDEWGIYNKGIKIQKRSPLKS